VSKLIIDTDVVKFASVAFRNFDLHADPPKARNNWFRKQAFHEVKAAIASGFAKIRRCVIWASGLARADLTPVLTALQDHQRFRRSVLS
jgi:hypothetical protein